MNTWQIIGLHAHLANVFRAAHGAGEIEYAYGMADAALCLEKAVGRPYNRYLIDQIRLIAAQAAYEKRKTNL